jgi:CheY-like chemotaxis protein
MGYAEMIMMDMEPDNPVYHNLQQMLNASQRGADLVRQLLAFARKQTIVPKVLDLNDTVSSMLKMIRRIIGEDIKTVLIPEANLWSVMVDPAQIDQILANLCVNARDAIEGVGRITIETQNITIDDSCYVSNFIPGEYVMLSVSDDGCGMDKDIIKNIFEPFFTTKEMGKGTGLGLATVYGIVRQNNGFINVYSEPNKGTTFKIYLPRYEDKAPLISEKGPVETITGGIETVLMVEDEPMLLEPAKAILEKLGYTVLTATTPGEAIHLAGEYTGEIHLLITDVIMPGMNGRDLAKELCSLHPNFKCLFMSGYTSDVIAHHGVLEKGVNFIQKPFTRKDLSTKVREVMDQK